MAKSTSTMSCPAIWSPREYWFEDYQVEDFALGPTTLTGIALPPVQEGQPVVATNALLLGYLYRPYTAHVGFVRLIYRF